MSIIFWGSLVLIALLQIGWFRTTVPGEYENYAVWALLGVLAMHHMFTAAAY